MNQQIEIFDETKREETKSKHIWSHFDMYCRSLWSDLQNLKIDFIKINNEITLTSVEIQKENLKSLNKRFYS